MARNTFEEMPSATSYSPRSFVCVNSRPELNMRPSIVLGRAVNSSGLMTNRVLSTTRVMRSVSASTVCPVVWYECTAAVDWAEEVEGPGRDIMRGAAKGVPLAVDELDPLDERSDPEPEPLILVTRVVVALRERERDLGVAAAQTLPLTLLRLARLSGGVVVCKLCLRLSNGDDSLGWIVTKQQQQQKNMEEDKERRLVYERPSGTDGKAEPARK